jgi:hypothetical protein
MTDEVYKRFQKKWNDITELPPQTVGPFTPYYKMITRRLKIMPLPVLVVASFVLIFILFFMIGSGITFLTTLLQRGF